MVDGEELLRRKGGCSHRTPCRCPAGFPPQGQKVGVKEARRLKRGHLGVLLCDDSDVQVVCQEEYFLRDHRVHAIVVHTGKSRLSQR
ncbi:unnamed protein product [Lampetra planeri]